VIGQDPGQLEHLSDGFHVGAVKPVSFEDWRVQAIANNPDLKAARLAVENARLEVSKNRAGHAPRVDMIASWSKGDSETLNTAGTSSVNRAIGVQVNIPIYQGGAISASTRQAAANYERAKAELDARINKVVVEVRSAHNVVMSAQRKVEALDKAVASGKELMKATEQSIKGGVRINLDLLNAQQQLYVSQRDLAQARYNYLIGMLRLRAATGIIGQTDIREIAAYFH
jgi:protease secretion system outer membrane protein